jgi:putative SOS response-associated peptidase YedK
MGGECGSTSRTRLAGKICCVCKVGLPEPHAGREWEDTFSIFTTDNNALWAPVHDRQPVILEVREFDEWLAESERPPVHLLRVFPADKMKMKTVDIW